MDEPHEVITDINVHEPNQNDLHKINKKIGQENPENNKGINEIEVEVEVEVEEKEEEKEGKIDEKEQIGIPEEEEKGDDDEWIDESEYVKELKPQEKKESIPKNKSLKGNSRRRNPSAKNLKYRFPSNDELDKRDISHGSIHYARTNKKYTVIKNRGNKPFSPKSPPFIVFERNNSNRTLEQSPLSNAIDTNRSFNHSFNRSFNNRQPIIVTETSPVPNQPLLSPIQQAVFSPNQSFVVPKADASFSSVASRASSVRMKRNIVRRFFHINLKKRQNKHKKSKLRE